MHTHLWREEAADEVTALGDSIRLHLMAGDSSQHLLLLTEPGSRVSTGSSQRLRMMAGLVTGECCESASSSQRIPSLNPADEAVRGDNSHRLLVAPTSASLSRLHTSSTPPLPEFPIGIIFRTTSGGDGLSSGPWAPATSTAPPSGEGGPAGLSSGPWAPATSTAPPSGEVGPAGLSSGPWAPATSTAPPSGEGGPAGTSPGPSAEGNLTAAARSQSPTQCQPNFPIPTAGDDLISGSIREMYAVNEEEGESEVGTAEALNAAKQTVQGEHAAVPGAGAPSAAPFFRRSPLLQLLMDQRGETAAGPGARPLPRRSFSASSILAFTPRTARPRSEAAPSAAASSSLVKLRLVSDGPVERSSAGASARALANARQLTTLCGSSADGDSRDDLSGALSVVRSGAGLQHSTSDNVHGQQRPKVMHGPTRKTASNVAAAVLPPPSLLFAVTQAAAEAAAALAAADGSVRGGGRRRGAGPSRSRRSLEAEARASSQHEPGEGQSSRGSFEIAQILQQQQRVGGGSRGGASRRGVEAAALMQQQLGSGGGGGTCVKRRSFEVHLPPNSSGGQQTSSSSTSRLAAVLAASSSLTGTLLPRQGLHRHASPQTSAAAALMLSPGALLAALQPPQLQGPYRAPIIIAPQQRPSSPRHALGLGPGALVAAAAAPTPGAAEAGPGGSEEGRYSDEGQYSAVRGTVFWDMLTRPRQPGDGT